MLNSKVVDPYAQALFNVSHKTENFQAISSNVNDLLELLDTNKDFGEFLNNPLFTKENKIKVLNNIFNLLNLHNYTRKFIVLLVQRERINLLQPIAEKYYELVYVANGLKIAQVSTASVLTLYQQDLLKWILCNYVGAKEIKLVISVDESLIAGLKIQIGSSRIDFSLKGKFLELAVQLGILESVF